MGRGGGRRSRRQAGNPHRGPRPPEGWPTPYPLPQRAAQFAQRHGERCRNLGLWLDHFVNWTERRRQLERSRDADRRAMAIRLFNNRAEVGRLLEDFRGRWEQTLAAQAAQIFTLQVEWRMVVGLGAASVLETSLTLHRLYGFPIIPGSALKGLTRSYALMEEKRREDDPLFVQVFGTTEVRGGAVFFDAIPVRLPRLELDVMTPHVGPYYQGEAPPADYLSPIPVQFLTVGQDSEFLFAVAAEDKQAKQTAVKWLQSALQKMGIGAKTVAGYGYLTA